MCIFFTTKSMRKTGKFSVLLLDENEFLRLWKSPYREVLEKHEPPSGSSKSYFYYAYERLKSLKVLKDKVLNFRLVLPIRRDKGRIELTDGIMVNDSGEITYWVEGDLYTDCDTCPVRVECVQALRKAAKGMGIKIKSLNPHEGWLSVIREIQESVLKNFKSVEIATTN